MTAFTEGQRVYLASGQVAEYVSKLKSGHLVLLGVYDDDCTVFEGFSEERTVYATAPKAVLDEEVAKFNEKRDRLKQEVAQLQNLLRETERENKERIERLKKYAALEKLDEYMAGKTTHFVTMPNEYEVCIKTLGEMKGPKDANDEREFRMLSLLGRGNSVGWFFNTYSDGSGRSWEECVPCLSLEDAQAVAAEKMAALIAKFLSNPNAWILERVSTSAAALGIEVPPSMPSAIKTAKLATLRGKAAATEAEFRKAITALEAEGVTV